MDELVKMKIQDQFERHEPFALSTDRVVHRFFAADETILLEAKMVVVVVNCAFDRKAIAAAAVEERHQVVFDFVVA